MPSQLSIKEQQELFSSSEYSENEKKDVLEEKDLQKLHDSLEDSSVSIEFDQSFSKKRIEKVVNGYVYIYIIISVVLFSFIHSLSNIGFKYTQGCHILWKTKIS